MKAVNYRVIVASVLENHGRYLCIEEKIAGDLKLNQPSGRLEVGESAAHGAVRETFEESGYSFLPTHIVGIYEYFDAHTSTIFLRIAYTGALFTPHGAATRGADPEITAVHWLTYEELERSRARHRSPCVLRCVSDYCSGKSYPLDLIAHSPAFPTL